MLIFVYLAISFIIFTFLVEFKYSYYGWAIDGRMVSTTLLQMYIPILYSLAISAFIILIYFGIKIINNKIKGKANNGKQN